MARKSRGAVVVTPMTEDSEFYRIEWFVLDAETGDMHIFPTEEWAQRWAEEHPRQGCVRQPQKIVTHVRE